MRKDRQYATEVAAIRRDHVARYEFAASRIRPGKYVLDLACGCGYGSFLMERAGLKVTGVDICQEAIDHAQAHFKGPTYLRQSAAETTGHWDAIVSFETLEHLSHPQEIFKNVKSPLVIASVPNEVRYPFSAANFKDDEYPHLRHYTPHEFESFLEGCGLRIDEWHCQKTKVAEVEPGIDGMFLIAVCTRSVL